MPWKFFIFADYNTNLKAMKMDAGDLQKSYNVLFVAKKLSEGKTGSSLS